MAKDLNKVMLTGRLGADPDMRFTPQGTPVTTFRVASNRTWKDASGERHEDVEWFQVAAWNKLGEICNDLLAKGMRVYVEGRSQTRSWIDDEGATRFRTEIVANDMIILEGRRDQASNEVAAPEAPAARTATVHVSMRGAAPPNRRMPVQKFDTSDFNPISDEDIPF